MQGFSASFATWMVAFLACSLTFLVLQVTCSPGSILLVMAGRLLSPFLCLLVPDLQYSAQCQRRQTVHQAGTSLVLGEGCRGAMGKCSRSCLRGARLCEGGRLVCPQISPYQLCYLFRIL